MTSVKAIPDRSSGIEPPSAVAHVHARKVYEPAAKLIDHIFEGDRNALARAVTLIESSRSEDRRLAEQILEGCLPRSGNSIRIGITGVPGAGKSTLIEAVGRHLVTECNQRVAVLAIDPTSQRSGGSILGDKTRMTFLASSEKAFIRPSPSRGAQGGVGQYTREAILLCEAAGFQNIFVETVGVGQSEVAVRGMVDFLLLLTLAGAGDELQGIKRGVMEMADLVVVNKADGENIRAAERARAEAEMALHFLPNSPSGWTPRALCGSVKSGKGVKELWSCVLEHQAITIANGWRERLRKEQARSWMKESLEQALMLLFRSDPEIQKNLAKVEKKVAAGQITQFRAVRELIDLYTSRLR